MHRESSVAVLALAVLAAVSACSEGPPRGLSEQAARRPGVAPAAREEAGQLREPGTAAQAVREVMTTCDGVEAILTQVPGAVVTTVAGGGADMTAERGGAPSRGGCLITATGTFKALRESMTPDSRVETALEARGFARDLLHDADGPNGTALTLRSAAIVCALDAQWDGGDDSDPAYVPKDWYTVRVACAPVAVVTPANRR